MINLNLMITVATLIAAARTSLFPGLQENNIDLLKIAQRPVQELLDYMGVTEYSLVIINFGSTSSTTLSKYESQLVNLGTSFFEVSSTNGSKNLATNALFQASKLSRSDRMPVVMVASEDLFTLESFAVESLQHRLLKWDTRLIVITNIDHVEVNRLLAGYWTFSMMDTIVIHINEIGDDQFRYSFYHYLPFSQNGGQVMKFGFWTEDNGIGVLSSLQPFPDKFSNFHGSTVNITALPFAPYWIEKKSSGNDSKVIYSGTDYFLLDVVAKTLNFSIHVLPTSSWAEVTQKVELRESFMATVYHIVLPKRMERYGLSFVYEFSSFAFSFSKPQVTPQWQSLYLPLSDEVWGTTLVALLLMPTVFYWMNCLHCYWSGNIAVSLSTCLQEFMALLLSQSLPRRGTEAHSSRAIIATWMLFSFIIASAYRGNLIAYLTLPSYPLRPETVEELVRVADRVTIPPYGQEFKDFFGKSDSEVFSTLSRLMHIVPNIQEGLRQVYEKRQGHLGSNRYQELNIAKQFTNADGTTQLYIGRDSIIPGQSAWPIPHDAPYREALDWCMMAAIEGGLYEKWNQVILRQTISETRRRLQKEHLNALDKGSLASNLETGFGQQSKQKEKDPNDKEIMALTLTHMQGLLFILAFGLSLAFFLFLGEMIFNENCKICSCTCKL